MTASPPKQIDTVVKTLLARFPAAELLRVLREINRTVLSPPEITRAIRREEKLKTSPRPGRPSMLRRWLREEVSEEAALEKAEREGASKTTLWRLRRILASRQSTNLDEWLSCQKRAGRLAATIEARELVRNMRMQTSRTSVPKMGDILERRNMGELDALIELSRSGFDALFKEEAPRVYRLRTSKQTER